MYRLILLPTGGNLMGQKTRGNITIVDYDGEKTTTQVRLANIGIAGATYASETQNLDEIKDAVALVILGNIVETSITDVFTEPAGGAVPNTAQRELKWNVVYKDMTQYSDAPLNAVPNYGYGQLFNMEIGTADPALLSAVPGAKDVMDIGAGDGLTFKNSLEANMRSPYGGTIQVQKVVLVGRNT